MKRLLMIAALLSLVGCAKDEVDTKETSTDPLPVFKLYTSEYPSWSTFVVAGKSGLINPEEGGEHGEYEVKHGVDIVLKVTDYDSCITAFGNSDADATCITNMDALNPSLVRATTVIMPTSTSAGGDQGIAVGATTIKDLKGVKVYGLDNSVSEYTHYRCVQKAGEDPTKYPFVNLDPAAAATAVQNGSDNVTAVCVWNPFALQIKNKNKNAKVVYSSATISGEILDCVVVGNDALKREGGENFAKALCDIQYAVCGKLGEDSVVKALKDDFAPDLSVEEMKKQVLVETKFYGTPAEGISTFGETLPTTMSVVTVTCQKIGILSDKTPTISYGDKEGADLTFTTKYMESVK